MSEKPTLRTQACRFRRNPKKSSSTNLGDWEPGIPFLESFDTSDVNFIVDSKGKMVSKDNLWTYDLLRLRVDGYIAIEPHDYAGKIYSPKDPVG